MQWVLIKVTGIRWRNAFPFADKQGYRKLFVNRCTSKNAEELNVCSGSKKTIPPGPAIWWLPGYAALIPVTDQC
jgi:hypothetical protein